MVHSNVSDTRFYRRYHVTWVSKRFSVHSYLFDYIRTDDVIPRFLELHSEREATGVSR